MNAIGKTEKKYSVEEYIAFEEQSEVRHEYFYGQLYPIENTTNVHNRIKQNVVYALRTAFNERDCYVFDENLKLETVKDGRYVYPDIMLTCDEDDKKAEYIIRQPTLIVEILSKSTAEFDRGDKFKLYQKIPSVKYYLLIDSRQKAVELFTRADSKSLWTYQIFTDVTDIVNISPIQFSMTVQAIYEKIALP